MSRYPTIDQPTTPLDGNGLPYQRLDAPLAAFAQPAGNLAQATDLLALGAQQYREQLLQHQLLAPESAASDALNQYRIDANDSWRRFGGSKLRDAVEGHDGYQQALQAHRAQALTGLSPAAVGLLRPHLDREHQDRVRLGEAHRNAQDQAWADHSSLASLDTDIEEAILHRDQPQRVMQLAQRGDGEWFQLGERRGWSDQQIVDQARASRGRLYGAVIDQHLHDGDIAGATTLLASVQNQLDPDTTTQLGGKIQLANARVDAQSDVPVPPRQVDFGDRIDATKQLIGAQAPNGVLSGTPGVADDQQLAQNTRPPAASGPQDQGSPENGITTKDSARQSDSGIPNQAPNNSLPLGQSIDKNGQTMPLDNGKPSKGFQYDDPHNKQITSYIVNAYGQAYVAQLLQSEWTGDGSFSGSEYSFADRVVYTIFKNLAQSGKTITQDDVNVAVWKVMGNKKALVLNPLAAVFVPNNVDKDQAFVGFHELRKSFTSHGPVWIQNFPGQTPSLKQMDVDKFKTRWVNIDADHYALVVPGQGFIAGKNGQIRTVTINDVLSQKRPDITKSDILGLLGGVDMPPSVNYSDYFDPDNTIVDPRPDSDSRLRTTLKERQRWIDIR